MPVGASDAVLSVSCEAILRWFDGRLRRPGCGPGGGLRADAHAACRDGSGAGSHDQETRRTPPVGVATSSRSGGCWWRRGRPASRLMQGQPLR